MNSKSATANEKYPKDLGATFSDSCGAFNWIDDTCAPEKGTGKG